MEAGQIGTERAGRLVAVVVTHNRLAELKRTVQNLLETPRDVLAHIVVVDNASGDGTGAWLAGQTDPRLDVRTLTQNGGGAGGFAVGMEHARQTHDPDWMVVMDDDARPDPGMLETFQCRNPTAWDAIAAAVYFPDGRICEMNRPSRNPFWQAGGIWRTLRRGRDGFHLPPEAYAGDQIRPIDVTSFVGLFISRKGLALAGVPDAGLFLYGDDGLYTLGLSAAGGRIGFDPVIRFEHACSTFSDAQRGRFSPLWKVYYYHRNLLMLYRLAAGRWFWPALVVILPKWLLKVRHHDGERRVFLRLMGWAVRDGLRQCTDRAHGSVLVASDKGAKP